MLVHLDEKSRLTVQTPWDYSVVCQRIPDKRAWDAKKKVWVVAPSRINIEYLRKELPQLTWSPSAEALATKVIRAGTPPPRADVSDYQFVDPPPYNHQREGFARCRDAVAYALLMQQRTGKTRVAVDDASDKWLRSQANLALVICPNSVKSVWVKDEIPTWTPKHVPYEAILYRSNERKDVTSRVHNWNGRTLQWLVINCETLSTSTGEDWLRDLLKTREVVAYVDEASRFKSPSSSRSKALVRLRPLCKYRRLLTGTLVTQGPLDVYMPFQFLDPAILGYSNFYSFRNEFALMKGLYGRQQIIGYTNLPRLADLIAPFSYRVTRDQCFDIPKSLYAKREVELTEQQRQLYNDMRDLMLAEFDDPNGMEVPLYDEDYNQVGTKRVQQVTATIVLTKMLRLQQIVGGFIHNAEGRVVPIPGKNPKLEALVEELEECQGKAIIWARFRPEIALIAETLRKKFGIDSVVEFHGGVKEADRTINRHAFQNLNSSVRWLVGQQGAGGLGIPLHAASEVFYFSNTYSLEEREQSEDRAQSLSRTTPVGYTDIVAPNTLDTKRILPALRGKKKYANEINRDTVKEWI
jgi:SNF2 family DNA or RNA helicase